MSKTYLTKEGFGKIQRELEILKSALPEMENTINTLTGYGFSSEDEALKETMEQLDFIAKRIELLTKMLSRAKLIGD